MRSFVVRPFVALFRLISRCVETHPAVYTFVSDSNGRERPEGVRI